MPRREQYPLHPGLGEGRFSCFAPFGFRGGGSLTAQFITNAKSFETLEGVATPAPLILDFDETLWLRNSTEEFLHAMRPSGRERRVLALIERYGPWRLARRRDRRTHWRDWMRIASMVRLRPGGLAAWDRGCSGLAMRHVNAPLLRLAREHERETVVVSNGFAPIIRPLLDGMGLGRVRLVAAPIRSGALWRCRGKLHNLTARMGPEMLGQSMVVTDSAEDADILAAARYAYLIKWPEALFRPYRARRRVAG